MKKLAIVGTHTRTRELAPWDDPDYEIWVFNEAPQADWCRRWDACFQLHRPEAYTSPNNHVRADHWTWLQEPHGKRIYMQAPDERVPDCVVYPLEDVLASVPGAHLRWFRSSMAFALALALQLGYREIDCYGLDMESNTEYGYQLPNWQFWVGVALGMGVRFGVLSNEQYFGGRLYGFEGEVQIERDYFRAKAAELKIAYKKADWELHKVKDRLFEAMQEGKFQKVAELNVEYAEAALAAGEASGRLAAAEKYAEREDLIPRQEFERGQAGPRIEGEELREKVHREHGKAEYVWNAWAQTGNPEALKQLRMFLAEKGRLSFEMGVRSGLYAENLTYMLELDERVKMAGGR